MAVTYALSIHTFIDDIGAYAGFAAAVGLALFALLLFSQARELKRLREWGAHTHDRIADLERRLAGALELARRANAPARAQTTGSGVQQPAAAGRPHSRTGGASVPARTSAPLKQPLLPAAPAGVAGPALASATTLLPRPAVPATVAPPAKPVPAPVSAPAPDPGIPAARPQAAPGVPVQTPAAQPAAAPALAPATAAAAKAPAGPAPTVAPATGNGHAAGSPPPVPPQRPNGPARPAARPPAPGARPGARPAPARPGQRPVRAGGGAARPTAAAAPLRSRTPSATARGAGALPPEASHNRRRVLLALGGGAALVVVVVAAMALMGGDGDTGSTPSAGSSPQQTTTTPSQSNDNAAPPHGRTTVGVLNGTLTQGLANTVATELAADGFKTGQVTNASSQDRPVTVVSYYGGHEAEAAEVAETLGVPSDAVQAIDPDTESKICATGAGTCPETVVVTVGADRQ